MFVAMWFLLIAPNQRKQKQWQAMLSKLKTGDKVTTNGGIRGTIVSVKDDVLVVKTAPDGVKLELVKSAIAKKDGVATGYTRLVDGSFDGSSFIYTVDGKAFYYDIAAGKQYELPVNGIDRGFDLAVAKRF